MERVLLSSLMLQLAHSTLEKRTEFRGLQSCFTDKKMEIIEANSKNDYKM